MNEQTYFIGIDSGIQNTKAVAILGEEVLAKVIVPTEFDADAAAVCALERLNATARIRETDDVALAVTGVGRDRIRLGGERINEIICASRGIYRVCPSCDLVIDIGAESSKVIRMADGGNVKNYEVNDKCAAGGGTFIETMARTLNLSIEELGDRSLHHKKELPMNAQCVVFVESEVVSMIHARESVEDIAYSLLCGITGRIGGMVRRLEPGSHTVLIGGPAKSEGLRVCLGNTLGCEVSVPEDPEYIGALGAAFELQKRHGGLEV